MSRSERFASYPKAWVVEDRKILEGRLVADQFVLARLTVDGSEELYTAPGKKVFQKKSGAMSRALYEMEEHISSLGKIVEQMKKDIIKEYNLDSQQAEALSI